MSTSCPLQSRVLFLTPGCFDKGGISRYSRYQINALNDIFGPKNIRVLALLGPGEHGFETALDVHWHGETDKATYLSRAQFALHAFQQAAVWKPHFIHCAHVNFAPMLTRLAKLAGAQTILNVYGLELWSGLSKLRREHMAQVDQIIADCHATAEHVVTEALHPRRPSVIWDCVDLERFSPGPLEPNLSNHYSLPEISRHRVIMTLGRLASTARHKGYDRLLEVLGPVRERVPSAHLVIAGRGDDAARLQRKAKVLRVDDCVTFTGAIDENDLPRLYRAAHVFALVSDKGPGRGEGIPLTPLEAMASGVPILVGDEDGSQEAVDGTRNGLVVSPRDLDAMTDALVALLTETGAVRSARKTAARTVAEERFGYEAFREKHRHFYLQLGETTDASS